MNNKCGIYIHIPFCLSKCSYCDFLSFSADDNLKQQYADALKNELISYSTAFSEYTVQTVFFGGGTPSILDCGQISSILDTVAAFFNLTNNAEITIEANPGTLTYEKLCEYKQSGINRLSIGLQSSNATMLNKLGRIHNYDQFQNNFELARRLGFQNINIDLIFGLPGQTLEGWQDTLNDVTVLEPEHMSCYGLIVEEGTPIALDSTPLPTDDEEREMYYLTNALLAKRGYERYEISNYSKKGFRCKHNLLYWDLDEYLGVGLGSHSYINFTRFCNTSSIVAYLAQFGSTVQPRSIDSAIRSREDITDIPFAERCREFMFMGLRKTEGISMMEFERRFNTELANVYGNIIDKHIKTGLLQINNGFVYLTDRGVDLSNIVFTEF